MKLEIGEPYRTDPISLGWHVNINGEGEFCCDVFSSVPGNAEKYARRIVAALQNAPRLAEACSMALSDCENDAWGDSELAHELRTALAAYEATKGDDA